MLDVGCGAGESTRDAARAAVRGSVLGVDVSAAMIERARRRSAEDGLTNVAYEVGDAQRHAFEPGRFDVLISRFGTMFFADPVAAFRNLAQAARPGARLVMMVWQREERNGWATAIRAALGGGVSSSPDPFSLGEPAVVEGILAAAGFGEIGFTDVDEPVCYGADADAACAFVGEFQMTREQLARLDEPGRERALDRLRAMLAAHHTSDGVWLPARSWIVTANAFPSC